MSGDNMGLSPQDYNVRSTSIEQGDTKQQTHRSSKSSVIKGHIYSLASKLGFEGKTAKVDKVFMKAEQAMEGLGDTVTNDHIKDHENEKIRSVATKMTSIGIELKDLQEKLKGKEKEFPELAKKLSDLQKVYVKLGVDFERLQRNDSKLDFDGLKDQLTSVMNSVLELRDNLSPAERVNQVFTKAENTMNNLESTSNERGRSIASIAAKMSTIGSALKDIQNKMKNKDIGDNPELAERLSSYQQMYLELGNSFDGILKFKGNFEGQKENIEILHAFMVGKIKEINDLHKDVDMAVTAKVAKELLPKGESSEGQDFGFAIKKYMKNEKGSYESKWNERRENWSNKSVEEIAHEHPQQFLQDGERESSKIGDKRFDPAGLESSRTVKLSTSDPIGKELMTSFSQSSEVAEFDDKTKHLLRYEIESIFCQSAYTLAGKPGEDFFEYCKASGLQPGRIVKPEIPTNKFEFTPPNTLTITRTDIFELKSEEDSKVKGYDATRTTITIDLSKVTPEKLLASEGAVSVNFNRHGVREKLDDVILL